MDYVGRAVWIMLYVDNAYCIVLRSPRGMAENPQATFASVAMTLLRGIYTGWL